MIPQLPNSKDPFDYIAWLRGSLDNSKDGASGKKMAAFYVVTILVTALLGIWTFWAYRNGKWDLLPDILGSLLFFAGSALAINGIEKITDKLKKNPNDTTDPTSNSTTTTDTTINASTTTTTSGPTGT